LKRAESVLVQVSVQSLGLDRATNTPVVILKEHEGERVLSIWIGPGEASAIAMELADMKFSRPLTHDLLAAVVSGLGGALQKVIISRVEENTYFAEMIIRRNGEVISVDARPSDSIAVALRLQADIFADEALLELTPLDAPGIPAIGEPPILEGESDTEMAAEELKEYLRKLAPEDFGRFTP
jgi:bifunctional DNase/RNase